MFALLVNITRQQFALTLTEAWGCQGVRMSGCQFVMVTWAPVTSRTNNAVSRTPRGFARIFQNVWQGRKMIVSYVFVYKQKVDLYKVKRTVANLGYVKILILRPRAVVFVKNNVLFTFKKWLGSF